ncbi:Protein phosphatase 2C family protein [Cryptosporidium meleagridis]|uniref:Protein phosphatase n=1 Tax=Cryptosporidium meleagridis TaxID=93969 RepID=A0A2P4Z4Q7_9CRYT|nr:Protein phosphatase 2C family protein [Cryptosporidium meleagridis]
MWNIASEFICGCFQQGGFAKKMLEDTAKELDITRADELSFFGAAISSQHELKQQKSSINADSWLVSWNLLGIADGVSSVESEGFDPSQLPSELLKNCVELCNIRENNRVQFDSVSQKIFNKNSIPFHSYEFLKHILCRSCSNCASYGSTTCLLCFLDGNQLWVSNVGDSQMIVLRPSKTEPKNLPPIPFIENPIERKPITGNPRRRLPSNISVGGYDITARSEVQQHFFNCPHQLTIMPDINCSNDEILKRAANVSQSFRVDVNPGDLIIIGTDGIFDNIFDEDIIDIVNQARKRYGRAFDENPIMVSDFIAKELLTYALKAANNVPSGSRARVTPFSEGALIDVNRHIEGGKPDDITVIVAFVAYSDRLSTRMSNISPEIYSGTSYLGSSAKFSNDMSTYIINGEKYSYSSISERFSILGGLTSKYK